MNRWRYSVMLAEIGVALQLTMSGCATLGGSAAEVGLAGLGGAVGYEVSDEKIEGAAVGAAVGYGAAKIAQHEIGRGETQAEKRGYDRAMNQAVKQQYWIIQNQQRGTTAQVRPAAMVPVVIPESKVDGVIRNESVAYVPVAP